MKITLLADIHGNLPALEAVLRDARYRGATQTVLNLGDLTGYGPNPEEVVQWSKNARVINILGNYDKKVISKSHRKNGWQKVNSADKRAMFAWTNQALSKASRKYLQTLPKTRLVEFDDAKLLMSHGSPNSISEHLTPDTPEERLAALAESSDADVILCGHSHQPFLRQVNGVLFINPGSVGRLDDGDPRASYVVLEINHGQVTPQYFRVSYDIMAAVQSMRLTGLPEIFAQVLRQGLNYDDTAAKLGKPIHPIPLEPNGTLTLLTDFGTQDHFVGVMKGVINEIAPHVTTIDINHQVRPQNVSLGAHLLAEAVSYFPPGTVHVAVVDPGVGTERRAIAAQIGDQFFVAPDNGLLTLILNQARETGKHIEIVALNQPKYWLPELSASFHGRDIFAPVGAHLANGLPLDRLGDEIHDPIMLDLPAPKSTVNGWLGEVVMVDAFGNLSTNLSEDMLGNNPKNVLVKIGEQRMQGLTETFGDEKPGALIATVDSRGTLAISIVNGNAAEALGADIGTPVKVELSAGNQVDVP